MTGRHTGRLTITAQALEDLIADAVLYPVTSRYVTGQTLHVNGGAYLG